VPDPVYSLKFYIVDIKKEAKSPYFILNDIPKGIARALHALAPNGAILRMSKIAPGDFIEPGFS